MYDFSYEIKPLQPTKEEREINRYVFVVDKPGKVEQIILRPFDTATTKEKGSLVSQIWTVLQRIVDMLKTAYDYVPDEQKKKIMEWAIKILIKLITKQLEKK